MVHRGDEALPCACSRNDAVGFGLYSFQMLLVVNVYHYPASKDSVIFRRLSHVHTQFIPVVRLAVNGNVSLEGIISGFFNSEEIDYSFFEEVRSLYAFQTFNVFVVKFPGTEISLAHQFVQQLVVAYGLICIVPQTAFIPAGLPGIVAYDNYAPHQSCDKQQDTGHQICPVQYGIPVFEPGIGYVDV